MSRISGFINSVQSHLLVQKRLITLLEMVLVVILAIQLGHLALGIWPGTGGTQPGLTVSSPSPSTESTSSSHTAAGYGPSSRLKSLFGVPPQGATGDSAYQEELQETRLDLKLKGILLNTETGVSLALIARSGSAEEIYRVGDEIEGAEIVRIEHRRVVIKRNGNTEALNLEIPGPGVAKQVKTVTGGGIGKSGIRRITDNDRIVSQQTLRQQLNNLPRLLQQARAVPHSVNGQSMGFKLVEVQAGSVFEDLGLQKEDVIQSVNGTALRTTEDALNAYRELRTSRSFQVSLLRSGRPLTLNLTVQ